MGRNGFWTGLVTGGILGISLVLLKYQSNEKAKDKISDDSFDSGISAEENYSYDSQSEASKTEKSSVESAVEGLNFSKKIQELEEALNQLREQE